MLTKPVFAAITLIAAAGFGLFWQQSRQGNTSLPVTLTDDRVLAGSVATDVLPQHGNSPDSSPFDTQPSDVVAANPTPVALNQAAAALSSESENPQQASTIDGSSSGLNVYDIARQGMSDEQIVELVAALRGDPVLLQNLMEEFRAETDAERLAWLALILGETGGSELTNLAAELAYSGDPGSQAAGLSLLGHLQPSDAEARNVIINLLSSETDPAVLKNVLNAVAIPGFASIDQEQALIDQLLPLASHQQAAVRSHSLAILSRWSSDEALAPLLQAGLLDNDQLVRTTAVFAIADHPQVSTDFRNDLFSVVENVDEVRRMREGALLALKKSDLSEQEQRRLHRAERVFNRRPSSRP